MEINLPVYSLFLIAIDSVGIVLAFFVGIKLLFVKPKSHISISILGILLILAGSTLLNDMFVTTGISSRIQWLYFLPIYYSLSLGPLFYLFIKSKYRTVLKRVDYLHLIIPVIQAVIYFTVGFRTAKFKSDLWLHTDFRVYLTVESVLFPISLAAYTIASYYILKKESSSTYFWSQDLYNWLSKFIKGLFIIAVIEMSLSIISLIPGLALDGIFITIVHSIILSSFVLWIALNGFKQYLPLQLYVSKPVHSTQLLTADEYQTIENKLLKLMKEAHVYLNPDLNLQLLASYLEISEKSCSHLLNAHLESNFNTVVNGYRVEAFKMKIRDANVKNYTLTAIAYECGFNSKSTFNRVFKNINGNTPSEYLKSLE